MVDRLKGDEELQRRLTALRTGKADRKILGQWAALGVRFAKQKVRRKSGNLGRTIRIDSVDVARQRASIMAGGSRNVGYAAYVEFGTRSHIIVPRRAKVLAWGGSRRLSGNLRSGAGATVFARRVKHPGSKPYPYLEPGAKQALKEVPLARAVITTWNEAA